MVAMSSVAEVTAARVIFADGNEMRLYTATATAAQTYDASSYFETLYDVRCWKESDGTDAEAFVTAGNYTPAITVTQNKGDILMCLIGKSVKSTGGST